MRYAFAGNRNVSVKILNLLKEEGQNPLALLLCEETRASHNNDLIEIFGQKENIIYGDAFKEEGNIKKLKSLNLDYIIGIHFPYIIPKEVLDIPKIGFLNLHPAYLPYNKGWHTPSWAIIDKTPYGATLHFMAEQLDAGDIIKQKKCEVYPNDTANTLYNRVLDLEIEVFKESLNSILSLSPNRIKQTSTGTSHNKSQLKKYQQIKLDELYTGEELINRLRALTTNVIGEAAYFENENEKFFVQINIIPAEI